MYFSKFAASFHAGVDEVVVLDANLEDHGATNLQGALLRMLCHIWMSAREDSFAEFVHELTSQISISLEDIYLPFLPSQERTLA